MQTLRLRDLFWETGGRSKEEKKEKKSGGYEPLVSMSHLSVLFFCHEDKLRWVIVAFFCTIYQRLSKCLLNPFPDTGFVDLRGGPGWAWSEADPSWCPSLTSASSALHKVTLTQPHLLLPLFSSTRLTLTSPSPLTQTHKALTKKKEKRGGWVALIKTTV